MFSRNMELEKLHSAYFQSVRAYPSGRDSKRSMLRALERYEWRMFNRTDDEVAVWSDLHLGHANILRYEGRPFKDVQSMDGYLWQRWEDIASESSIST